MTIAIALAGARDAPAQLQSWIKLADVNERLDGTILDYTHNHGADNRRWSPILGMRRDLYVYVPPGYTPDRAYPLVLWLHGGFGDGHAFLDTARIEYLDRLIRRGCCPPMIVACPDGTCDGRNLVCSAHSLYINSRCGRFEDHIVCEVVPFLQANFSICRDRRHHALIGVSAGGYGAMSLGIKYRSYFGVVATLAGAINLRYDTRRNAYFADFDPATYRWETRYEPWEGIARFCVLRLPAWVLIRPVFGGDGAIEQIRRTNPADLIFSTDLRPGELDLFVGYGGKDNFNFDAQGASFVWLANQKGIPVTVHRDPDAGHELDFFRTGHEVLYGWLAECFARGCCSAADGPPQPTVRAHPDGRPPPRKEPSS